MPPDRSYIETVLSDIEKSVRFLKQFTEGSKNDFLADNKNCYSAAYALIMAIEGAAAIAAHILANEGYSPPASVAEGYESLAKADIIKDAQLCSRLVAMARFRNLLVHRYWKIDYDLVYQVLTDSLSDFTLYAQQIQEHLESLGL